MRYIVQVLSIMLALAASPLQAQPVSAPPPWPKYFDLRGISEAQYSVAVTHTGTVAVSVRWEGDPLTVVITKPNGQQFYSNAKEPPLQAQAVATADDVRPGAAWRVAVYATPIKGGNPNTGQHVKGTINVQVPGLIAGPQVGQLVGQTPPPPLPPGVKYTNRIQSSPPSQTPARDEQTCFAYSNTVGGPLAARCEQSRSACEEDVRTNTINGSPANMVVVLGCSRAPLYCFAYNNGKSSVCYADGNECVSARNNFASQQGSGQVGICRAYTYGAVHM
jgi:hypothetical protein